MTKPHNYDWRAIRDRYVMGTESLEDIANDPTMPAWRTLKTHSGKDNWPDQRAQYRHQISSKVRQEASTTEAEVAARHVRIAQAVIGKGLEALRNLEPSTLTPYQLLRYIQTGAEIERRAMSMDGQSGGANVPWESLTIDQLKRIAAGETPEVVLAE